MTGLAALLKKEFKEQLRTYKLLIVAAVFLLFGFATPLLTRYMSRLMEMTGEDIIIQMPEPTALMSLAEYADTVMQVGILVAVLIAMGSIARERDKGTAAMVLSKPVGHGAFVLAKLVAISTSFVVALGLGSSACYAYTVLLIEPASASSFFGLNLLLALFFVLCISVTLLFSSLFRNSLAAGGIALVVLIVLGILTQVPWIGDYTPGRLIGWGTGLLTGSPDSAWGAFGVSLGIIITCLFLSGLMLRRREL